MLARATGERGKVATRLREQFRAMQPGVFAERVTHELFELAAARPVRFEADEEEPAASVKRVVAVAQPVPATEDPESRLLSRALLTRLLETGPGSLVRGVVKERWAALSQRRRRVGSRRSVQPAWR